MGKTVYLAFVEGGHAGLFNKKANPAATPGKETPYIKSLGRRVQEEEFNQPTAEMLRAGLKRAGVHVYNTAQDGRDTPLKERTDYANKIYWQYCSKYGRENVKAIFISIHFNALDGFFDTAKNPSGFSVHIYEGQKNKDAGKLAQAIINELKNGTKQINRGVVEQDLYVTRETDMPAALSENGFMDHVAEALLMIDPNFQKEVAEEHERGILKYFGIYKEPAKPIEKKDEVEEVEKVVVIGGYPDFAAAELVAVRLKAPIYFRNALPGGKLAKEVYVVGGTTQGLQGDKIINLTGANRFEVMEKVKTFLG